MIQKVLFFSSLSLTERTVKNYYFERLMEEGYVVEYIDLSKIYNPELYRQSHYDKIKIHTLVSLIEVEEVLKQNQSEGSLYFSILTFDNTTYQLFRLFKKYKCRLATFTRGAFPSLSTNRKIFVRLFNADIKSYVKYMKLLITFIAKRMNMVKCYDYVLNCGNSLSIIGLGWKQDVRKAKIIPVNTVDYEEIRNVKTNNLGLEENQYIVFLDEYLPFHPDWEILKDIVPIPSKLYYKNLLSCFTRIEQKFKKPIIIAAHPKANKYQESNFFDGRQVFFNRTAELVRYSKFVLVHNSTSLGFAVTTHKPIVFLNSLLHKQYMPLYYHWINHLSSYLNTSIIHFDENVSKNDNFALSLQIDSDRYDSYRYNFLASKEVENLKTEDIFVRAVKNMK